VRVQGATLSEVVSEAVGELRGGEASRLVAANAQDHDEALAARATELVAMLESAARADARVHGLVAAEPLDRVRDNREAALAGAWLVAGSAELAAELGEQPLRLQSQAAARVARGWMIEAEDLYDAGRPVARAVEAASCLRGSLFGLGAALGGWVRGAPGGELRALERAAAELGLAARIRDELAALSPDHEQPGEALARGVYSVPVAFALEAEPELAASLGGALDAPELPGLAGRVLERGGPAAGGLAAQRERAGRA
jgi:hypothetical protein